MTAERALISRMTLNIVKATIVHVSALLIVLPSWDQARRTLKQGSIPIVLERSPSGSAVGPDSPDHIRTRGDRQARTVSTMHYSVS